MSTKISQLPVATSPVAPDAVLPVVQAGETRKASIDQLGFLQSGTGAITRTIQNKLRDTVSVKDFGAVGDGVANDTAAFSTASTASLFAGVSPGTYLLASSPTSNVNTVWSLQPGVTFNGGGKLIGSVINIGKNHSGQWPQNVSPLMSGIYDYLETTASFSVLADSGIAVSGLARSSQGGGASGDAHIGVAAFGYNDYVAGDSGIWGLYSTVVRLATATGPTHGIEIDVANLGTTQIIYPAFLNPTSLTSGAWIAAGGEITNVVGDNTGSASCAIGIVRNDTQNRSTVNFEKGIIFGNTAIAGTTGTSGAGVAIAFASCHFMTWFNNSNQQVANIGCNVQTAANGQTIQITDNGIFITNVVDNGITFQVEPTANSVNYAAVSGAATGVSPSISTQGSDTNIDFAIFTKGTGTLKFGTFTSNADAPVTGYITIKDAAGNIRKLATIA